MTDPRVTPGPASMYEERYWAAQKALDEILGTEEEDGAGEGFVAEIWLVAEQRNEARAERDNALAEVADLRGRLTAAALNVAARRKELDALAARLERAEAERDAMRPVVEAAEAFRGGFAPDFVEFYTRSNEHVLTCALITAVDTYRAATPSTPEGP